MRIQKNRLEDFLKQGGTAERKRSVLGKVQVCTVVRGVFLCAYTGCFVEYIWIL